MTSSSLDIELQLSLIMVDGTLQNGPDHNCVRSSMFSKNTFEQNGHLIKTTAHFHPMNSGSPACLSSVTPVTFRQLSLVFPSYVL